MADSRHNPMLDRFPAVRGTGTCREGGAAGSMRCEAAPAARVDFGAPVKGEVGWADAPSIYEGGTLETVGPLSTTIAPAVGAVIPTDRHTRGGTAEMERAREAPINLQPHRQARNMETRLQGECSRHIAHQESQQRTLEWRQRMDSECKSCVVDGSDDATAAAAAF